MTTSLVGGVGHVILAKGMTVVGAAAALARGRQQGVAAAVLAQLLLAEPVTALRRTGIGFIVLAVFLVGRT
jgi:drug/metabolite transporter (DMT)-like permease